MAVAMSVSAVCPVRVMAGVSDASQPPREIGCEELLVMPAAAVQDPHPLDGAEELGAHCQGPALAAFVKQYFSVIQYDFMKRGYLCHAGAALILP